MSDTVTTWVNGYRQAWESNDPDDIRVLFTEDAEYRTEPFAAPWRGHDEIIAGWLAARDEPGTTQFQWEPVVIKGETAVVQGTSLYPGRIYHNLWVIRMAADGRARAFTEWWMEQPGIE